RYPRLTCTSPASSTQGTRKMIWRSGSHSRISTPLAAYSGCLPWRTSRDSNTSLTAWWNSGSPGFRRRTWSKVSWSVESSIAVLSVARAGPGVAEVLGSRRHGDPRPPASERPPEYAVIARDETGCPVAEHAGDEADHRRRGPVDPCPGPL